MAEDRGGGGERTVTERELQLMRRGVVERVLNRHGGPMMRSKIREIAREMYPLPPVERPRVVDFGMGQYRVHDGVLQRRYNASEAWRDVPQDGQWAIALTDLLTHPTETVPDEEEADMGSSR